MNQAALSRRSPTWGRLSAYLQKREFWLYRDTAAAYFGDGEAFFRDLIEHLRQAETYIFMEYYILAEGTVWDEIFAVLKERAAAGVEIHLIIDDFGTLTRLSDGTLQAIKDAGIEVEIFNPVHRYINRLYFNYRDHRKITVIDGYVAYAGGINIGDEYANRIERFGYWKDSTVRLTGDGAWGFAVQFMQMWKMLGRSFPNEDDFYRPRREGPKTEGFCQPFEDGPLNNPDDPVEAAYVQLIASAKRMVYLTTPYYAVEESVQEALCIAADAGVDVRLIYDDFGCVTTLPYQYYKSLQQMGIKCAAFNQFRPVLNVILNNRDHRKIAVIDGHTAFTGGINLADEYINRKERFGHWKDSGICLHGEAVWSFTVMFLQMWSTITGMECNFESYRPEIYHEEAFKKDGFVQPYGDSPLDGETVGEHVYLNIISQAKKYLYIFTPYLIPDNETLTALCMAAKRGVDVRIVTPGIPDKKIVYILTQANYEILLESGVQIYQYTPGFIHSKSFVCDDEVATVGTINMDYRSMYLHFECGVWMYGSSAVAQGKEDALITFEQCEQINMDYCRKKNFAVRALRGALKFLAPLL